MNGTLIKGTTASNGIKPLPKPRIPPIPATVVQVMRVAKPKPDVGITSGSVTISSRRLFPRKLFLARTYAKGIPKRRSKTTVERDNLKEKLRTLIIFVIN